MIISIHQPAYFPWMPYFDRIRKSDIHVVLDHVQYSRGDFINRQKVDGKWLTVPIVGSMQPINEIVIDNVQPWYQKHRKTLVQNHYMDEWTASLLVYPYYHLNNLLEYQRMYFMKMLGINTPVYHSSDFNFKEHKADLVLEICQHFGATQYLSGPMGRDYLDLNKFNEAGIEVVFDDPAPNSPTILKYMKNG